MLLWRHQRKVCQVNRKEYYTKQISPVAFTIQADINENFWMAVKAAHAENKNTNSSKMFFSTELRKFLQTKLFPDDPEPRKRIACVYVEM